MDTITAQVCPFCQAPIRPRNLLEADSSHTPDGDAWCECAGAYPAAEHLRARIQEAIQRACQATQFIELGSITPKEYGEHPYDGLLRVLREATAYVEELKTHEHQWNDEDLCDLCGADGRA